MGGLLHKKAQDQFGDEERWQEELSSLPFGRLAEAAEVADLAVMLASPRASYLSGTVVDVDGGQSNKGPPWPRLIARNRVGADASSKTSPWGTSTSTLSAAR